MFILGSFLCSFIFFVLFPYMLILLMHPQMCVKRMASDSFLPSATVQYRRTLRQVTWLSKDIPAMEMPLCVQQHHMQYECMNSELWPLLRRKLVVSCGWLRVRYLLSLLVTLCVTAVVWQEVFYTACAELLLLSVSPAATSSLLC